jgi:hypothetical protein
MNEHNVNGNGGWQRKLKKIRTMPKTLTTYNEQLLSRNERSRTRRKCQCQRWLAVKLQDSHFELWLAQATHSTAQPPRPPTHPPANTFGFHSGPWPAKYPQQDSLLRVSPQPSAGEVSTAYSWVSLRPSAGNGTSQQDSLVTDFTSALGRSRSLPTGFFTYCFHPGARPGTEPHNRFIYLLISLRPSVGP